MGIAGVAYGITFSTVDEASRSAQLIFSAPSRDQVPIILKLTCGLCGTHPSTLVRQSARRRHMDVPKLTEPELNGWPWGGDVGSCFGFER